jgi:hypothetical protein
MLLPIPYNRMRAVDYAKKWALSRNPLFFDFSEIGGNCTNFVSQCIFAGAPIMNYTKTFGWYYIDQNNRAPAWSGVEFFYRFMTGDAEFSLNNGGVGPYGSEIRRRFAMIGDVVQLADMSGDYYHTLIISAIEGDEIYVCAHTNDALDRPLSSYDYAAERFIHIEGVREDIDEYYCFQNLVNGASLPIPEQLRRNNQNNR